MPDLRTFTLPLDQYRESDDGAEVVGRANAILFARCMQQFGFDVPSTPVKPSPVQGYELRYGLADDAKAHQFGYHVRQALSAAPGAASPEKPSAAYQAVAQGQGPSTYQGQQVPDGGCSGESWRRLAEGAPPVEDPRLGDRLAVEAFQRMNQDSRVRAAFGKWSACMKQHGFDYADPSKAVNDPTFQTDQPSVAEIAVASADVQCKKDARVIEVQAAVETAYQQLAVERHSEALMLVQRLVKAREKNAARVVAGS